MALSLQLLSHCVPTVQATQPMVMSHKDSQNLRGHWWPHFQAVSLSKTLSCFVPFPPTVASYSWMSLIIWVVERSPEPFPVDGVLMQDRGSAWAWVLEYSLTNSFLVLMKNFWASSIATLIGVALIESKFNR